MHLWNTITHPELYLFSTTTCEFPKYSIHVLVQRKGVELMVKYSCVIDDKAGETQGTVFKCCWRAREVHRGTLEHKITLILYPEFQHFYLKHVSTVPRREKQWGSENSIPTRIIVGTSSGTCHVTQG